MVGKPKILYVQTSGVDTPERTYAPFILAKTAIMMDIDATIYFLIKGVTILKKGEAEKIKLGDFPTLKEVMDDAVESGVKLLVCSQSCRLIGIEQDTLVPDAKIVGAATLNDLAIESDGVLYF